MFKREHFRYYTEQWDGPAKYFVLRDGDRVRRFDAGLCGYFQVVDVAASEKQMADYTVCTTCAVTPDKDILILEVDRQHFELLAVPQFLAAKNEEHDGIPMYVEAFGHGTGPIKWLIREAFPVRRLEKNHGAQLDKIARSMTAQVAYENHRVFHARGTDWVGDLEHELTTFPNGRNDDQVDTISYATRIAPTFGTPSRANAQLPPPRPKPLSAGVRSVQF